jgi:exopolysaccharide biosynthesis polyprenyl glycosylphosphotransferase
LVLPDAILLYFSLYASVKLRYGGLSLPEWSAHLKAFSIIFIFWLLVFYIHGFFEIKTLRRYSVLFFNLISAMAVNLLLAILYFYLQPNLILTPRRFLFIEIGIASLFILIWHLFIKALIKNRLTEGLYLLSFNGELKEMEQEIKNNSFLGYRVLGNLVSEDLERANFTKNSGIILPDNLQTSPEIAERLYQLRTTGVKFYNYKDFYEQLLRKVYLSQLSEVWFLENIDYQEKRFYNIVKRFTDLVLGLIGFVFFIASLPFCALAIKVSSKGPVLFIQERVGKKGELFKVYKYRTMDGSVTNTWTSVNDPRITKVGKILRKSRIDEWPQFINLLLGHISLVGPRPEQPHIVEDLKKQIPFYDERHLVKPGITGWAQINNIYAGNAEETKLKLQYDLYYIKNRSFLFDVEIILKTTYYIFTWKGI